MAGLSVLLFALAASCSGSGAGENSDTGTLGRRWSDPLTWQTGTVPGAGDSVAIAAGETIILDTLTAPLDRLRIEGNLVADPAVDVAITSNTIRIEGGGKLEIGTAAVPFRRSAIITLTGERSQHVPRSEDNALDNDGITRGLMVMPGGTLRLIGATPPLLKTKLADHAQVGATTFVLADPVDWRAGDRVAISMTDFYGVGQTETFMLAANTVGGMMETTTALATPRWGKLQYPLDTPVNGSGVGLTPGPFTPPDPLTARELDERATVVNLSRRIVIQGADDAAWQNSGFGAHVMVMGLQSVAQVSGVEFRRCGQRRAMGRYPFHWHMLSYTSAVNGQGGGAFLGDVNAGDHFLRDSSIWRSENRAVTIHGTCGVTVENTYAVDIMGHAFFMEDGSERRNTITDCVAMKQRDAGANGRLKVHDDSPAGFWLTNPDNTIARNESSDGVRGLWNSFATRCFGQSRNCSIVPEDIDLRVFDDNVGHSNQLQGIVTNFVVTDEAGNIAELRYSPAGEVFTMNRNQVWKNSHGGYANRVGAARYNHWVAADNDNFHDFAGQTEGAVMRGTLLVGKSLNSATPLRDPRRNGLASYHYALDILDITAINYPFVPPGRPEPAVYGGGVFDSADLYTHSIALGGYRSSGWKLVNSNAGYLTPPPYFDGFPLAFGSNRFRYWALPGAIWDPHGYWGPAGNYLVPDVPFYTFGLSSSVPVAPAGQNRLSTPDMFYGLENIFLDQENNNYVPLRCGRLNSGFVEVGEHTIGDPALTYFFPNMRHFGIARGGIYRVTFPGWRLPNNALTFVINNGYRANDWVVLGMPWPSNVTVVGREDSGWGGGTEQERVQAGTTRLFTRGTSINSVLNDSTGATIWQDQANNTVWFKHVGGLVQDRHGFNGNNDQALAKPYVVRFRAGP